MAGNSNQGISEQQDGSAAPKTGTRPAILAVPLLAAIVAAALLFGRNEAPAPPAEPPRQKAPSELSSLCGKLVGNADAQVKVTAVLPVSVGCQDDVGLYLLSLARRFPDRLCVQVLDMKQEDGRRFMAGQGLKCASVVVNGKTQFELDADGDKLLLEGPPGVNYTLEELRRALISEMKRLQAEPLPDLPMPPPAAAAESSISAKKAQ